jgi:hypothetical protein
MLINRARLGALLQSFKVKHVEDGFMHSCATSESALYRDYITNCGFPVIDNAPEIKGSDQRNLTSPGAMFIKECLGTRDHVVINSTYHMDRATYDVDGTVESVDLTGLRHFRSRYVSHKRVLKQTARVSVPLNDNEYAEIEDVELLLSDRLIKVTRRRRL